MVYGRELNHGRVGICQVRPHFSIRHDYNDYNVCVCYEKCGEILITFFPSYSTYHLYWNWELIVLGINIQIYCILSYLPHSLCIVATHQYSAVLYNVRCQGRILLRNWFTRLWSNRVICQWRQNEGIKHKLFYQCVRCLPVYNLF